MSKLHASVYRKAARAVERSDLASFFSCVAVSNAEQALSRKYYGHRHAYVNVFGVDGPTGRYLFIHDVREAGGNPFRALALNFMAEMVESNSLPDDMEPK